MDWLITVILSKMVLRNLKKKIINPIIYLQNIDHSFLEQEFVFSEDLLTIYNDFSGCNWQYIRGRVQYWKHLLLECSDTVWTVKAQLIHVQNSIVWNMIDFIGHFGGKGVSQ